MLLLQYEGDIWADQGYRQRKLDQRQVVLNFCSRFTLFSRRDAYMVLLDDLVAAFVEPRYRTISHCPIIDTLIIAGKNASHSFARG
jgi:hypothetical protein